MSWSIHIPPCARQISFDFAISVWHWRKEVNDSPLNCGLGLFLQFPFSVQARVKSTLLSFLGLVPGVLGISQIIG